MQSGPKRPDRLWEAAEAVRPGGEDLSDPAFAELREQLAADPALAAAYARLKRLDERIGEAFQGIQPRAGLERRILERLAEAQEAREQMPEGEVSGEAGASNLPDQGPGAQGLAGPKPRSKRQRRRWIFWLSGVGALAAAASVLVAVLISGQGRTVLDEPAVRLAALDQFEEDANLFGRGLRVSERVPPERFPPSPDVHIVGARWRRLRSFLGREAVAYDIPLRGGGRATLYATRASVPGLPSAPPPVPFSSGRRCLAAWQAGPLLYVLVLDQSPQVYRRLVVLPGPIT